MRISIAQINSTIGDFSKNLEKIIEFSKNAYQNDNADMVLFPELAICGYPPMDLLDQNTFVEQNIRSLRILQRELPRNIAVGLGYVNRNASLQGKSLVNAYGIIFEGALCFEQIKTLLPTYDVFDEARNFEPARTWPRFDFMGQRIGFAICEDVWRETETPGTKYSEDPVRRLLDNGITMLVVPSASPYYTYKHRDRLNLAKNISLRGDIPLVYINAVGANDSIIFDGRSFFMDAQGNTLTAHAFREDLVTIDTPANKEVGVADDAAAAVARGSSVDNGGSTPVSTPAACDNGAFPSLYDAELDTLADALVMGIREYMGKCGFAKAHLGLSGGIDSGLVAYLAVRAIGSENVVTISMPSRFSSQGSKDDAAKLAENLGCRYETLPIEPVFTAFLDTLKDVFQGRPFDVAEENLQARIRGSLLMAFSNKWSSMLLTTGNKSELAMGYCTLYGDMNGALCPIGDLFKTEVFALCKRINEKAITETGKPIIPPAIIEKPPSAELRPNQKDQDSLPPYDVLDEILSLYLFENLNAREIHERGYDLGLVSSIIKTVARAEFKRRQAPPVLKVSPRAFGMGRRMPIARCIYEI